MKQWDIYSYDFEHRLHPAIIISHQAFIDHEHYATVNVLSCSTQQAMRRPKPTEVLLDQADGLDWETICRCDIIFSAKKADLKQHRGHVTEARQIQLARAIVSSFNLRLY